MRPTFIRQPGPAEAERLVAVAGRGRAVRLRLPAGRRLVDAMADAFAAQGFAGGTACVDGLALAPFAYVMPALAPDAEHAAFYSETFRPAGVARIESGAMSFGRRDGAPFFHCHGLWREETGRRGGGHVLPEETILAEDAEIAGFGVDGAIFEAAPDPETNFKLFGPVAAPLAGEGPGAGCAILRVRPNVDLHGALEGFCESMGWRAAILRGGVGSTIGAAFDDGRIVERFATEVFVKGGVVSRSASREWAARIEVGIVDHAGGIAEGVLRRGDNPVLMTFELVLEPTVAA